RPQLPVMVRTRDESHVKELREAGAAEVVAETLEAGLMIGVHALLLLNVPVSRVMNYMQAQREGRYHLLRGFFQGDSTLANIQQEHGPDRLRPVVLPEDSPFIGRALKDLDLDNVAVAALVRQGQRRISPSADTILEISDVVV